MPALSFDVFCRVVDNFGDIGVCWRLARQLREEGCAVRLWVDELASFARIEPRVAPDSAEQHVAGIAIHRWDAGPCSAQPAEVVIEAFACSPPADFVARMAETGSVWINLEYLSAEDWVESCHGLPSPQPNGLRKAFFFPGFTPATGGLLRERNLIAQREDWQAHPQARTSLLRQLGVPAAFIARLERGGRLAFVFCYGSAPLAGLVSALGRQRQPTLLLAPRGIHAGLHTSTPPNVEIREIPFVDQEGFDRLLWSSDLNFVRGEDSLVRALWAGRPMVWQIYPQAEDAHLVKLQAWLEKSPLPEAAHRAMHAWNGHDPDAVTEALDAALAPSAWETWQIAMSDWTRTLAAQPGLTLNLIRFCAESRQTR